MSTKYHFYYAIVLASLVIFLGYFLFPAPLSIQQKPEEPTNQIYDHYIIVDETDEHVLMQVSVTVTVGDELLSEENNFYRIVKIEQNRAYARFIGSLELEKLKRNIP